MLKKIFASLFILLLFLIGGYYWYGIKNKTDVSIEKDWTTKGYGTLIDSFHNQEKFPDWQKWKYESDLKHAGVKFRYDTSTRRYYLMTEDYQNLDIQTKRYIDSIRKPQKSLPRGTVEPRAKVEFRVFQKTGKKIPLTCESVDRGLCTAFLGDNLEAEDEKTKKIRKLVGKNLDKIFGENIKVDFVHDKFNW